MVVHRTPEYQGHSTVVLTLAMVQKIFFDQVPVLLRSPLQISVQVSNIVWFLETVLVLLLVAMSMDNVVLVLPLRRKWP